MSNEEGRLIDPRKIPSWDRYYLGVHSIFHAKHDPEDTMQVALTERELAVLAFGTMLVSTMFPEVGRVGRDINGKLIELSMAQEFLPWTDAERDEHEEAKGE